MVFYALYDLSNSTAYHDMTLRTVYKKNSHHNNPYSQNNYLGA